MKRSIGELLFDGYEDTVMDIGSSMDNEDEYFEYEDEEETEEDANKVPMDKFGWFYQVCPKYSGFFFNGSLKLFSVTVLAGLTET